MRLFIYFIAFLIFIITFSYYLNNNALIYQEIINNVQYDSLHLEREVSFNIAITKKADDVWAASINKNNIAYYIAIIISILMIENAVRKKSLK